MNHQSEEGPKPHSCEGTGERLTSSELAALIVDALLRPGILDENDVRRAIAIASEEIDVRKALGDY